MDLTSEGSGCHGHIVGGGGDDPIVIDCHKHHICICISKYAHLRLSSVFAGYPAFLAQLIGHFLSRYSL